MVCVCVWGGGGERKHPFVYLLTNLILFPNSFLTVTEKKRKNAQTFDSLTFCKKQKKWALCPLLFPILWNLQRQVDCFYDRAHNTLS